MSNAQVLRLIIQDVLMMLAIGAMTLWSIGWVFVFPVIGLLYLLGVVH